MSQNSLNKFKNNLTLSKNGFNCDTKNKSAKKENKNLYDLLKPIVHDYTKLCKKNNHSVSGITKKTERNDQSSIKLIFEEPKSKRMDNFIKNNVDKIFLCSICDSLYKDPLECYKCLNLYCTECIKKKLEEFKKCPKCFNMIFQEMMRTVDMEQMDSYKLARVKCPFVGCRENLRLKEIEEHMGICIFQDMTENKKKNLNKLIFKNDSEDPLMKTHMLNYLKEVNKSLTKLTNNNSNNMRETKPLTLEDLGFNSMLPNLKIQMTNLNDYTSGIMGEMTKVTKLTNANLKNLINN